MINTTTVNRKSSEKVHPVHALFGLVPNWFLLGTVNQQPDYASWTLSPEAFEKEESVTDGKPAKRAGSYRKPIRIQIVKTRFCTYVIER